MDHGCRLADRTALRVLLRNHLAWFPDALACALNRFVSCSAHCAAHPSFWHTASSPVLARSSAARWRCSAPTPATACTVPSLKRRIFLIIFGHDIWLHALTAIIAAGFGFTTIGQLSAAPKRGDSRAVQERG
jgi:hypothetical protein